MGVPFVVGIIIGYFVRWGTPSAKQIQYEKLTLQQSQKVDLIVSEFKKETISKFQKQNAVDEINELNNTILEHRKNKDDITRQNINYLDTTTTTQTKQETATTTPIDTANTNLGLQ